MRKVCEYCRGEGRSELIAEIDELGEEVASLDAHLARHEETIKSLEIILWPDCSEKDREASTYLVNLVTRAGKLARAARDTQGWSTYEKALAANHKLAKMVYLLRRDMETLERRQLSAVYAESSK